MEKAREFQKNIYFCSTGYAKAFNCVDPNKLWEILQEMGLPDHLTCLKVKEEGGKNWLKTQHSENQDHGIWSHHFMGNRWGNSGNGDRLLFWGASKSLQMVTAAMKLKDACSFEEKL